MSSITTIEKNGFTYYLLQSNIEHYKKLKDEEAKPKNGSMGKYLLFSDNPQILYDQAVNICIRFDLSIFAISTDNANRGKFSYVCKIYDTSDKYSQLLPKYIDLTLVEYRYFKLERLSRKGIYSRQYINSLKTKT